MTTPQSLFSNIAHFYGLVDGVASLHDAHNFLRDVARLLGFRYFAAMRSIPVAEIRLTGHVLVSNFPDGFLAEFDQRKLLQKSANFAASRNSVKPLFWDTEAIRRAPPGSYSRESIDYLESHGFLRGAYLSAHDAAGNRGAVMFAGDRHASDLAEAAQLTLIVNYFFEKLFSILATAEPLPGPPLNTRELQCLKWSAAGKTSAEIAMILGLSEHTINQYMVACCQKLGTVNRIQAVAKAVRMRLID